MTTGPKQSDKTTLPKMVLREESLANSARSLPGSKFVTEGTNRICSMAYHRGRDRRSARVDCDPDCPAWDDQVRGAGREVGAHRIETNGSEIGGLRAA